MFPFLKNKQSSESCDSASRLRLFFIIGGALLGVCLLLFGSGIFKAKEKEELPDPTDSYYDAWILYQSQLETKIKQLCETVNGVGNVTVIVTLENGFEDIYATEEKDGNTEYVIVGSGSSASALFLTRAAPSIGGIGVVCTGGNNPVVQREISSLLCATFHISSNRVYVTGGNS